MIIQKEKKEIGFYGISFKQGTDDLRFSPALELTERLLGKGYHIRIFDANVNISCLMGKNKEFLYNKLPHINEILHENLDEFLKGLEVLVIVNKDEELDSLIEKEMNGIMVVDLIRIFDKNTRWVNYEGICW